LFLTRSPDHAVFLRPRQMMINAMTERSATRRWLNRRNG
jgi:hypothetical protein